MAKPSILLYPVTIPEGESLSDAANTGDNRICGFLFPATWRAAAISWQTSFDGGVTWYEVTDAWGDPIPNPQKGMAGSYFVLDSARYDSLSWVKIRSGSLAQPVEQGANCTITIMALLAKSAAAEQPVP